MKDLTRNIPGLTVDLVELLEKRYQHSDQAKPYETSIRQIDFEAGQRSVVLFLRSLIKRQEKK